MTGATAAKPLQKKAKPAASRPASKPVPRPGPPDDPRVEKLRRIVGVMNLVIFVLASALVLAIFTKPDKIAYFAVHEDKEPQRVWDLLTPTYTEQAILSWIGTAASDVLNFGFHNVDQRLDQARSYFTDEGWDSFTTALENGGFIESVVAKQQVLTSAPTGAPVIVGMKEDKVRGVIWTAQIPFAITVLSGKQSDIQRRILTLTIVRVPPSHNLSGLGIDNWIMGQ